MTPEQFCYWLQGRAELVEGPPSPDEWKAICEHLQTVFQKETPPVDKTKVKPIAMPVPRDPWTPPRRMC